MWGIIATWRMAFDGVTVASQLLKEGIAVGDAIELAIRLIEDNPLYKSVGYGGLPNIQGTVQLDAAYMDGDTYQIGSVAGISDVKNPISVAKQLSKERFNSFLVGEGARDYAVLHGFDIQNMLTDRAKNEWEKRLKEVQKNKLNPYDGHDTVGMVGLDVSGSMATGTSSSGLFMKQAGRIGDSPLSGSGFYVDSDIGGATATGLGEDLMKGCLSYEIVRLMKDGYSPQAACNQAVYDFADRLTKRNETAGAFSLIAMNRHGEWGVATNVEFAFVVATEKQKPTVYVATPTKDKQTTIEKMSEEWLEQQRKHATID
ncbi:N(4)-(beta-N-acetylglucosaminyl)-L-asparaginase [Enterococcus saccharolyticus]|uniref:N(4)-(beta-N-acetylglucosaminyl)-L-asparaginase n=1 Tax=Enterococcus saccharolyticus TaxID=41997 RepID=UPI001E38E4D1|nr:N(4)-(beta-N-acetylglucosaminyl)-L-asparaginase [Enterococcus saccharolyticus]MCD5001895.1 N(4)-(beta-N-acetylglucosaminyl)-L-asparaginase [Enterococcus saccharolyticus]